MRFAARRGSVLIEYEIEGSGDPIVMLHGFAESSGFWREFGYYEECLAHGRQVVLIDLRGHGQSTKLTDPVSYGLVNFGRDVVAVLDDAGIERADLLGYGMGGRIALATAALAPDRVHAVAAGGTHPFAERTQRYRDGLAQGLESWIKVVEAASGGISADTRNRILANDPAAIAAAVAFDRPDIADAITKSGVPILLFLGKDDPRYSLALSFAEQSGATVIGLAGHGCVTAATAARSIVLPKILEFFEDPRRNARIELIPPGLCRQGPTRYRAD
jgi:pimeloyl-ACP methyl ester carboxylesterase